MNFKSSVLLTAISLTALFNAGAQADAGKYYYFVGYMAQPAPHQYQHVYERKIITIKADGNSGKAADQLKDHYVAFIKKNHPEYYTAYISNVTDAQYREFLIRAQASVQGYFTKEEDARRAMASVIKDRKERFAKDPNNGPVVESDEYSYP